MPEFTGNVHNLELALPFPAPATGGNTVFVVGRTFGAPGSDVLDVWVDDTASNTYDPPDGAAITLPIRTLIACTHGWLRFVAAGQPVPGLRTRDGSPLIVTDATLVLEVWPTLRDNLERMAEDGSYLIPQTEEGRGGRPALEYLLYENVDLLTLDAAIEALIKEARPDPFFTAAERTDDGAVVPRRPDPDPRARRPRDRRSGGRRPRPATVPSGAGPSWRRLTFRAVDRLGQLFDPGYFLRRVQELGDLVEIPVVIDKTLIPSRDAVKDHPLPKLTPRRRIVDWRDEFGRPVAEARFTLPPATGAATTFVATDAAGLWIGPTLAAGDDRSRSHGSLVPEAEHPARDAAERAAVGSCARARRDGRRLPGRLGGRPRGVVSRPRRRRDRRSEPLRRFSEGNRVTAMVDARRTYSMIYRAFRRTFRDDDFTGVDEGGRPRPKARRSPTSTGTASTSPAGSSRPNCGCPTSRPRRSRCRPTARRPR